MPHASPDKSLRLGVVAVLLSLAGSQEARAQVSVKPRFIIVVDSSGSMTENAGRVRTHGDGSALHLGCDLNDNGRYDDSKLYQAKAALNDTIAAFGAAEFSLARYHQNELGQACMNTPECTARGNGSTGCIDGFCAFTPPSNTTDYNECSGGSVNGNGCVRCASPDNDPAHIYYNGNACCTAGDPTSGGYGMAGDVLVAFPPQGGRNYKEILSWLDGVEDFPAGTNRELRGSGVTPIGGSLNAVRDWLVNDASQAGAGAGVLNRDTQIACRSYNVILITDGIETQSCSNSCGINGQLAADLLYHACTNGGVYDPIDQRCEKAGNPAGTSEVRVRTYVVGFTVNDPSLNGIAAAGGTNEALLANDQAELTARLGDIIAGSIPVETCDCKDNTCDGLVDESFPKKGEACTIGTGRCKRAGVWACSPDGTGLVCSSTPAGMCPGQAVVAGQPVQEICGATAGCLAPSADDCADDDCDGLVDENLTCACIAKPEVCNGLDDDCNGMTDDVPAVACGLAIGECRPGQTQCVTEGGGKKTVCVGGQGPVAEVCDGKDNDCDGITDGFGTGCYPANTSGCSFMGAPDSCGGAPLDKWTCAGICQPGVSTCTNGQCGACRNAVTPLPEVACDGLDNDCDGMTDEGFNIGGPCGPGAGGKGLCRAGVLTCKGSQLVCEGGQGPVDEICNGQDDDCNGVDDDLTGTCGVVKGECKAGRLVCTPNGPVCRKDQGPKPETCNGKDDDCDGTTDEDPTDLDLVVPTACGTDEGICTKGLLRCIGGTKVCDGAMEAERERCNARDDDCDAMTDEGINAPGPCPPPGLAPNAPIVGECRPGMNACAADGQGGASWTCLGGVGPIDEICDGKDQDCDGVADDGAPCPAGQTCAFGECNPLCVAGEIECPPDRACKDGVCLKDECVRTPCPRGFRCDSRRGCVDKCENVTCLAGQRCDDGLCTSCFVTGCNPGEICRGATCEPDPCAALECGAGTYCREGTCVASCNGVRCGSGQSCRFGTCMPDRCLNKTCNRGELCNPTTGACELNPCNVITCIRGQVCAPLRAMCIPDPCIATACKGEDVCVVRPEGLAECVDRRTLPEFRTRNVELAGSGCSCVVGGTATPTSGPWLLAAVGFAGLVATRRSSRRRGGGR